MTPWSLNPMEQFEVKPLVASLCSISAAIRSTSPTRRSDGDRGRRRVFVFLTLAVKPGRLVPTRSQSMAELSYEFVANMIHSATGEDGLKFFPFVFTLFIFVLFCNFFGMMPGSFTVTSQIAVTFALACAGDPDGDRGRLHASTASAF